MFVKSDSGPRWVVIGSDVHGGCSKTDPSVLGLRGFINICVGCVCAGPYGKRTFELKCCLFALANEKAKCKLKFPS